MNFRGIKLVNKIGLGIFLLIILLMVNCAISYKQINLGELQYRTMSDESDLIFMVTEDPLLETNNRRYRKHVALDHYQLISVRVINGSDSLRYLHTNQMYFTDDNNTMFKMVDSKSLDRNELVPPAWPYWFYSPILLFLNSIPIPIGVVIGMSQFTKVKNNNGQFRADVEYLHIKDNYRFAPKEKKEFLILLTTTDQSWEPYSSKIAVRLRNNN